MADGKTGKTLNLTEGNPLKLILLFAIPVFLGRLFQMMYSLIDTKIVGSILGEEALAAVGSVSILYNLLTGIFSGFTLGFSIVTAQNYGSGNEKLLKKNVASSIMLGMMTAVVIIFAVLLFLNPILHAMNVPEEQFCMAHDYIRILVWGMFVTLAYNLCADMLRAIGDSVTPLIFLVIAAVTNIVLDYLFIGGFSMGVSGAACATVLSQLVSAVLCFLRIKSGFPILHISKNDLEWERERMRILLIGGSKSGKSTMGQRLTRAFAAGAPMYYWATMEPTDEEDLARIARHLKDREGWGFETIERGRDLLPALERIDPAGAVLFDSITAQLACEMFGETIDKTAPARAGEELLTVSRYPEHFICTCDDLWRGGGRFDEWTELYRAGLAQICRRLAAEFDVVCEMTAGVPHVWKCDAVAGMPHVWKGELPDA